ncbi:unnamed protein product [Schistosoma mattheei]|uniref:Uncharacterized protein n=1 Tax=Schistosoma mattheei TaxID=31246 RepID=A0AA85BNH1_9TREM|nr:unnamed protein product [Schistosoma mattheei]
MKFNKKSTEIAANNQCPQNFDLTCEFHLNPSNHQSNVNLMNSSLSNSVDKSVSNPICNDSYLYDTTINQLLTLKSATIKKQHTNTSICSKTPFISKTQDPFNTIGYETGQVNTNHEFYPEIIKCDSKTLPLCKLQSKTIPSMQTVPHFIYISNPSNDNNNNNNNNNTDGNNQMTELNTFTSTKNIPSAQPVNYEQVINRTCEHILENNQYICPNICINSSSTSLCECKRGDSDFDFSNILFNNPPDYYPIHKIHGHQQSIHVQTEQQQQQQYGFRKFITHENRDEKCNSMASCMINYEAGENVTRSRINLSKYFKCCHRLTMILICLLIFICLCYRIIDYFNRHEMMKSLFVYNKFPLSKQSSYNHIDDNGNNKLLSLMHKEEQNISDWFTITLCNLNPIRGSALFTVENGSEIYDHIIKIRQNEIDFTGITKIVNNNNALVSKALLKQTGHKLNEMLKFCSTGNEKCSHRNFTSVLTIYGQCYRMNLQPSVYEVRIVLDSQDYDYIIPHKGLIGFRLWIHPSEQKASYILDLKDDKDNPWKNTQNENVIDFNSLQQSNIIQSNEITVSTEFQTLIRVALDMNVHYKRINTKNGLCSTSTGFTECEQNANQKLPTDTVWLSDKYNHNIWNARIVSATQSSKATIMYSLLALRNPNLFIRNKIDLERGLRIQQRAFIQLTNETAFNELRKLVPGYDDLRNQLRSIKQLLHEIEIGIWRDQREALQMTHTDSACSKMVIGYFETLINITKSFQDELCKLSSIDVLYTTSFFNCLNHTQSMYDYRSQLNMNSTYQFPLYNRLSSLRFRIHPRTNNHTSIIHDSVNNIDMNYYENMQNPSLMGLQVIHLFFSNITYNSNLKDVLRKYLKLLSAKRMQMATRTSNTRYGLSLTSHSSQSSSSTSSTNSLTPISSSIVLSSSSTSTSSSPPSALLSSSSGSTITSHSLQLSDRTITQNSLNNAETNQPLCTSQIQIHIDSIYKVKLEKLGEAIATCLQRLELFQTSMNLIIKWNRQILETFSIDYEHLQKVDEKSLVAFTVQFETIGNDISMTQLTPMDKIFNPFGEIMGICFGTLSLLIPLYLVVDYFFTIKCKSSMDRQGVI